MKKAIINEILENLATSQNVELSEVKERIRLYEMGMLKRGIHADCVGVDFMTFLQNNFGMGVISEIFGGQFNFDNQYIWHKWEQTSRNSVKFFNGFVHNGPHQKALIAWYERSTKDLGYYSRP